MTTKKRTQTKKLSFKEAYNELNESKKAILRAAFINHFEYKSFDTFYKRLSGESELKRIEREFIADQMKMPVDAIEWEGGNND